MIWDEYQRFAYEGGFEHGHAGYDLSTTCDRFYRLGWLVARGVDAAEKNSSGREKSA